MAVLDSTHGAISPAPVRVENQEQPSVELMRFRGMDPVQLIREANALLIDHKALSVMKRNPSKNRLLHISDKLKEQFRENPLSNFASSLAKEESMKRRKELLDSEIQNDLKSIEGITEVITEKLQGKGGEEYALALQKILNELQKVLLPPRNISSTDLATVSAGSGGIAVGQQCMAATAWAAQFDPMLEKEATRQLSTVLMLSVPEFVVLTAAGIAVEHSYKTWNWTQGFVGIGLAAATFGAIAVFAGPGLIVAGGSIIAAKAVVEVGTAALNRKRSRSELEASSPEPGGEPDAKRRRIDDAPVSHEEFHLGDMWMQTLSESNPEKGE